MLGVINTGIPLGFHFICMLLLTTDIFTKAEAIMAGKTENEVAQGLKRKPTHVRVTSGTGL